MDPVDYRDPIVYNSTFFHHRLGAHRCMALMEIPRLRLGAVLVLCRVLLIIEFHGKWFWDDGESHDGKYKNPLEW